MRLRVRPWATALLVLTLAACGGGGGGGRSNPVAPAAPKQTSTVTLTFAVGGPSSTIQGHRRPDYISRATQGLGIRWRPNGGAFTGSVTMPGAGNVAADVSLGNANCVTGVSPARTCTVTIAATVGYDDFEITLWDAPPASGTFSGNQLSNALISGQLILQNQTNVISFTLNGVVASVALSLTNASLVSGAPATTTLDVLAKDAAGNIIISPGVYVDSSGSPVTITVSATPACTSGPPACSSPGTTALGVSSFAGPAVTSTTVTYDGGPLTRSVFAVTAPSLSGNSGATLNFTNTAGGVLIPGSPTITEFSTGITVGNQPVGITTGPDGNLWFAEVTGTSGNTIGRITPAGAITEFTTGITPGAGPRGITTGPDGNLWFTELNGTRIARMTPAGTVTEFSAGISAASEPLSIVSGPDGNLWFTELNASRIGRITPSGVVTEFSAGITGINMGGLAVGSDGNLWFTEGYSDYSGSPGKVGRITTSGTVTEFSAGITGLVNSIAFGPDGNLWFTEVDVNKVARMTMSGAVTEFTLSPNSNPFEITTGPDGNLWFTENAGSKIGRITVSGTVTEFSNGIAAGSAPLYITTGPDGNLWFTEYNAGRIGKLVP